jgi:hypothetical protein
LVRVRVRTYVKDVNLRKWETSIDLRIGGRFENLIKGHRSEVQ